MSILLLIIVFIAIAVALVTFLLKSDKGEKEPVYALWTAAGFGFVGAIAAAFIEKLVIPMHDIQSGAPLTTMLGSFLVIGFIEESLKFMPLALFIYKKRYFNEHIDGIIFFALAGLGFGLPENILYTIQFGSKAGLGRLIMTPFFHAAITAMVGYFLIKAKLAKRNPLIVLPMFLLAVVLHGFYDFGLSSGVYLYTILSIVITMVLSVNLFNLTFKAEDSDEDEGLASIGHNNFCRTCGAPNSKHYLYCAHCGQRA